MLNKLRSRHKLTTTTHGLRCWIKTFAERRGLAASLDVDFGGRLMGQPEPDLNRTVRPLVALRVPSAQGTLHTLRNEWFQGICQAMSHATLADTTLAF